MYSSQLKVSLLSLSVLLAISSPAVLAAKLTIEQRLELLESELSANKKELQKTQSQLSTYKDKVAVLQKSIKENEQRNVTAGYPTATSPVAENIANENNEISQRRRRQKSKRHSRWRSLIPTARRRKLRA